MLGLTFSSKLDWGSHIIVKSASKEIGPLILWSFFILRLLCISINLPYCCHAWAGALSYYLELLDKLQKQICRTLDPSLAASLELLAHGRNVASLVYLLF